MSDFMCYIAKEKCGCVTAGCVDDPQFAKYTAKDISDWIKDGRIVERVTGTYFKNNFCKCPKYSTKKWDTKSCRICLLTLEICPLCSKPLKSGERNPHKECVDREQFLADRR